MNIKYTIAACLILASVCQMTMAASTQEGHNAELAKLAQELKQAHENYKHQIMGKIANLDTPEAIHHLCQIVEDRNAPIVRRRNAITPLGPRVRQYEEIESMLFRLLKDPQFDGSAASYLVRHGSKEMLMRLDTLWTEENPPPWANAAAAALIPKMGDKEISVRFQSRIEDKTLRFDGLGGSEWDNIPGSYRKRLLSFIRTRPIDKRDLVYEAAKSGSLAGQADCIDHICDKMALPHPVIQKWAAGWTELQIMKRVLKNNPELKPNVKDETTARKIAGVSARTPVLDNQRRWFVLMDNGHPGADGNFRITIIDAASRKILKTIGCDGRRTIPQMLPMKSEESKDNRAQPEDPLDKK